MNFRRLVIRTAIAGAVGIVGLTRAKPAAAAMETCAVCVPGLVCTDDNGDCMDFCGLPSSGECHPGAPECGSSNYHMTICKPME